MDTNMNQNTEQQPTTPTPEVSGDQGEKLFTQGRQPSGETAAGLTLCSDC